jgi:hypothetical protein
VLIALSAGDSDSAQRHIAEMRRNSEEVLRCLDAFGREYPTTFAPKAA